MKKAAMFLIAGLVIAGAALYANCACSLVSSSDSYTFDSCDSNDCSTSYINADTVYIYCKGDDEDYEEIQCFVNAFSTSYSVSGATGGTWSYKFSGYAYCQRFDCADDNMDMHAGLGDGAVGLLNASCNIDQYTSTTAVTDRCFMTAYQSIPYNVSVNITHNTAAKIFYDDDADENEVVTSKSHVYNKLTDFTNLQGC